MLLELCLSKMLDQIEVRDSWILQFPGRNLGSPTWVLLLLISSWLLLSRQISASNYLLRQVFPPILSEEVLSLHLY